MSNESYRLEIIETKQTVEVIEEGIVAQSVAMVEEAEHQFIEIVDRGLQGPPGADGAGALTTSNFNKIFLTNGSPVAGDGVRVLGTGTITFPAAVDGAELFVSNESPGDITITAADASTVAGGLTYAQPIGTQLYVKSGGNWKLVSPVDPEEFMKFPLAP